MLHILKIVFVLILLILPHFVWSSNANYLNHWMFRFAGLDSSLTYAKMLGNESGWQAITIPHSFNLNQNIFAPQKGFGWYSTEIKIPLKKDQDVFLAFKGVCLRCKVFINGEFAGENRLNYLPFKINITRYCDENKNIGIAVQVDNQLLQRDFPDNSCDAFWIYGGIIREVFVETLPRLRIENFQVRTICIANDSFKVNIAFDTVQTSPDSVHFLITSPTKKTTIFTCRLNNKQTFAAFTIGGVSSWNPDQPILYDFEIIPYWKGLPHEPISLKRGFMQLAVIQGELRLNGKPIFLRGIGRHDVLDHARGPLLTREERLKDLLMIKSLGTNMLRIAHYPQHSDIYEICDSIGLIVMDEIPVWKSNPDVLGDTLGQQLAKKYMDKLIDAHGNNTCIGIWCFGNEINSLKYSVANYVKEMAGYLRVRDPSRLCTYTSFYFQFDKAFEYVDIMAVNEYFGWFLGSVDMLNLMFEAMHEHFPGRPIIVTEFGASAGLGIRNPNAKLANAIGSVFTKDFSEEYQALLLKEQIKTIWKNRKVCFGASAWCFNDFMQDRKTPNPKTLKKGITGFGVVTQDRKKKLSFNAVKKEFETIKQEMARLNGY